MRVVHATTLTAAVLLLASVAPAQGLGDAAAREKAKRKAAPAKPAKVYTEGDIGPSIAPASATQELPADSASGSQPAAEGGTAPADAGAKAAGSEEDAKAKAEAEGAWRQQLDQARKEEAFYKDAVDKTQLQLNDTSGMYSSAWTAAQAALEDYKLKLAQAQGKVAALEAEGQRNSYR